MRRTPCVLLFAMAACAGAEVIAPTASQVIAESSDDAPARLTISGDEVVAIASPIDVRALPASVRLACDAVAPGGTMIFCAKERNARGRGYRVEKRFVQPAPHDRSLFVTVDGDVLEQRRTLPISEAPQPVLAAALKHGSFVERIEIVAGPDHDEHWQVVIRDRDSRQYAVTVELNGQLRNVRRRLVGRVDS